MAQARSLPHPRFLPWPGLLLIAAALVLMAEPALWLLRTWSDPAYASSGALVFVLTAGLFCWSATSPLVAPGGARDRRAAIWLFIASGVIRLLGQVLAINMLGALCLVADVYALGLLLRLDRRERAVSPGWLALAFAFSLPLERVLQRGIGHLLQEASAEGACFVLSALYPGIECLGVRLIVEEVDILVDLPCSGARTLLTGLLGFVIAAAVTRPTTGWALIGGVLTLAAAAFANVIRISVLAIGIAEPGRLGGIEVMAAPWHDAIGLAALMLVLATVLLWARHAVAIRRSRVFAEVIEPVPAPSSGRGRRLARWGAVSALVAAIIVVNLPREAVDVAEASPTETLPLKLAGAHRHEVALTPREEAFFTRYGGSAAKASYGDFGLMVTRTTSPLRHLHAPEDCLRGLGFEVDYLGAVFDPLPSAVYRGTDPAGRRYLIEVSFISDRGW